MRGATLTIAANTAGDAHVVPIGGRGVVPAARPRTPPDGDRDGVADGADRCPTLAGPITRSGCPAGLLADPSIAYKRSGRGSGSSRTTSRPRPERRSS